MSMFRRRALRTTAAAVAAIGLTVPLTACGNGDDAAAPGNGATANNGAAADNGGGANDDAVAAALEAGGELLIWAWEPTLAPVVEAFEAKHPNVDIQLVNVGTGNDHYTALQNAIQAGSGVPDIAQVEYAVIAQFTIIDALADLTPFGAGELEEVFAPGPWSAVASQDGVFGMPNDSGPMAFFYRYDVFERYGLEVPTTWEEYLEMARRLNEANPAIDFLMDGNDAGPVAALAWQAGGRPFTGEGETVGIDLVGDPGVQRFVDVWQQLIDEDLMNATLAGWSDEWFQALSNGSLATMISAAWMPANLISGAPGGSGYWRVAPLPQWEAGANASAELGGSSLAVTSASTNQALAYAFLYFTTVGEGIQIRLDAGTFPATRAELQDEDFLGREFEYFGGQQVNRIFAESSANVLQGWQHLPFQAYANTIFPDTVGQAFIGSGTLAEGIAAWQARLISFAQGQGFTVQ